MDGVVVKMFETIVLWIFKIGVAMFLIGIILMAICGAIAVAVEVFS